LAAAEELSRRTGFENLLGPARDFLDASQHREHDVDHSYKTKGLGYGTLLRSRWDRLKLIFVRNVTAVVGADRDALSMVYAIAETLDSVGQLVVIAGHSDVQQIQELRDIGARVVIANFNRPNGLAAVPIWRQIERLYLLGPDAATNLRRLETISRQISEGQTRRRVPLIVRIDDPWQAQSWRARQLGDNRWASDAVGRYEVTANRLIDRIVDSAEFGPIGRLLLCGTSPLAFALCDALARRRVERDYYTSPDAVTLPAVTLVAEGAEDYRLDYEHHQRRLGLASAGGWLSAVNTPPTLQALTSVVNEAAGFTAIIFVEDAKGNAANDVMLGTRLAERFQAVPIFVLDSAASEVGHTRPVIGRLHSYSLGMDLPRGQAVDTWERAAVLMHERYAAGTDRSRPTSRPWMELDEFYRESNRRQVRNVLWMVEQIAGHTWASGDVADVAQDDPVLSARLPPLERLQLLGFDRESAVAMARAEHADWCRHYQAAGWRYGPSRDIDRKVHDKLLPWSEIEQDPHQLDMALMSLATTLESLRALGYRSTPLWQRFRRTRDPFDMVFARRASAGEAVDTPGGAVALSPGDWVVKNDRDEVRPVSAGGFACDYEGPV
jgi:hypothetical protein